jgi:hypothetical protein
MAMPSKTPRFTLRVIPAEALRPSGFIGGPYAIQAILQRLRSLLRTVSSKTELARKRLVERLVSRDAWIDDVRIL